MKKKIFCAFVILILFGIKCFAQASATANVSATIIDADELVRNARYNMHSKLSSTDKMRIADSVLSVQEKIKLKTRFSERTAHMKENEIYASAVGKPKPLTKDQIWYGQVHMSLGEDVWQKIFYRKTPQKSHIYKRTDKNGINRH